MVIRALLACNTSHLSLAAVMVWMCCVQYLCLIKFANVVTQHMVREAQLAAAACCENCMVGTFNIECINASCW